MLCNLTVEFFMEFSTNYMSNTLVGSETNSRSYEWIEIQVRLETSAPCLLFDDRWSWSSAGKAFLWTNLLPISKINKHVITLSNLIQLAENWVGHSHLEALPSFFDCNIDAWYDGCPNNCNTKTFKYACARSSCILCGKFHEILHLQNKDKILD